MPRCREKRIQISETASLLKRAAFLLDFHFFSLLPFSTGDYSEDETPVPIPNTTVKGLSGDDTAGETAGK